MALNPPAILYTYKAMPIKGLTDKDSSFPKIGALRKGAKKVSDNAPGKDLNHFRFDSQDERAIADFEAKYGSQPTEVNVFLPYPSTEQNFFTCKEEWVAGGLKHRCDGEFCMAKRVGNVIQRHFMKPEPCPGNCKEVGRLKVIIPELKRFAYVSVETHSINDIVNLHQQLNAVETTFGQLNAIPFVLRRRPEKISTPGKDGNRARREKWMLSIEVSPDWADLRLESVRINALQQAGNVGAIASSLDYKSLPPAEIPKQLKPADPEPVKTFEYQQEMPWFKFKKALAEAVQKGDVRRVEEIQNNAYSKIPSILPEHSRSAIDFAVDEALDAIAATGITVQSEPIQIAKPKPVKAVKAEIVEEEVSEVELMNRALNNAR